MNKDEKEKISAKVKIILPGIAKVIFAVIPTTRTFGLVAVGSIAVFSLVFPSIIDDQTKASLYSIFGF